jgi:RNA polymerase sigma-70 factor (ECF subfamily)
VEEPEPAVLRAAMGGDLEAFERLVRMYQPLVWRFLRHLLRDEVLAEDVTQETFIHLFRRLPSFNFRCKFSSWVFRVARNAGIDAIRSRERHDRLARAVPAPPSVLPPETRAEVQAAVESLTTKLREALLLIEVFGLSYREASGVLHVPEGTVKSRVFQARRRLAVWRSEGGRAHEL